MSKEAKEAMDAFEALLAGKKRDPQHPQVVFLEKLKQKHYRIASVGFWRDLDPMTSAAPRVYLTIENGGPPHQQAMDWTPDLEAFLFRNGVKAEDEDQEAERGAYLLLQNLRWADAKWGSKTFVDSVLHQIVSESFGKIVPIKDLLAAIHIDKSHSSQQAECYAYLRHCISGYANSLIFELGYRRAFASGIVSLAVARMLDERFGITERYTIFPLRR